MPNVAGRQDFGKKQDVNSPLFFKQFGKCA